MKYKIYLIIILAFVYLCSVKMIFLFNITNDISPTELKIKLQKENKNALLFFSTTCCGACIHMKNAIEGNIKLSNYINKKYIALYIDEKDKYFKEYYKKYKAQIYPTIVILDKNSEEKFRIGYYNDKKFFEVLKYIESNMLMDIEYILDDLYKNDEYDVFKDIFEGSIIHNLHVKNDLKPAIKLLKKYEKKINSYQLIDINLLFAEYLAYYTDDKDNKAIFYFENALKIAKSDQCKKINRQNTITYRYLVYITESKRNIDRGIQLAEKIYNKNKVKTYITLLQIYTHTKDTKRIKKLLKDYEELIKDKEEFNKCSVYTYLYILHFFVDYKKIDFNSKKLLKSILDKSKDWDKSNHNLYLIGLIYCKIGENKEALKIANIIKTKFHNDIDARLDYLTLMLKLNIDIEKHFKELKKLERQVAFELPFYYQVKARYQEKLGLYQDAIDSYNKVIENTGCKIGIQEEIDKLEKKIKTQNKGK